MSAHPLVVANWKMNGSRADNASLLAGLLDGLRVPHVPVVICPPAPYLEQVVGLLAESELEVGGQDCSHSSSGAFTGEVSPQMLRDIGCGWVILGHSERRQYHRETDEVVAAKAAAAQAAGLRTIVCVGETREQREAGSAIDIVLGQLKGALGVGEDRGAGSGHDRRSELTQVAIAYEPVWAIGTGITATPEAAQEMHASIREWLISQDPVVGPTTSILYGGSVKPDNAQALFAMEDIDGALVGGASLDAGAFADIVSAAA
ncbi:MAG: triose-phosphate isomerase [Pseudomonadota bacterium]